MTTSSYDMPVYVHPNCLIDAVGLLCGDITEEKMPGITASLERGWSTVWAEAIKRALPLVDAGYRVKDMLPIRGDLLPDMKYYRQRDGKQIAVLASDVEYKFSDEDMERLTAIDRYDFHPLDLNRAHLAAIDESIELSGL